MKEKNIITMEVIKLTILLNLAVFKPCWGTIMKIYPLN